MGLAGIGLLTTVLAGWATRVLFDSGEFADRSVATLDSAAVRHTLAVELTEEIVAAGPSNLDSFRPLIEQALEDVVATPAFHSLFRVAVEQAHQAAFHRHADRSLLELGETLAMLAGSTEDADPGLAQALPAEGSSILVDVSSVVGRIDPWRVAERARWLDDAAAAVTLASVVGAIVLAGGRRRRVLRRLGVTVVVVGLVVAFLTFALPDVLADRVRDPTLVAAVRGGVVHFLSDLRAAGYWLLIVGVVFTAAVTAIDVPELEHVLDRLGRRVRRAVTGAGGRGRQALAGLGCVLVGWLLVAYPTATIAVAAATTGAFLAYLGLVAVVVAALGPRATSTDVGARERTPWTPRSVVVAAALGVALLVAAVLGFSVVSQVGARARAGGELRCNGSAALCDRPLDRVLFAGAHNAMSSASDPGWLFAEQLEGIPAQLDAGVRALLLKSHYGIDTGVDLAGTRLVVTDTDAETANDPSDEAAELGPEAVARARQLEASVPRDPDAHHEVYLCHVYCSLGATKMSTTLRQVRHFLEREPDQVVILFVGDYASAADTAAVFDEAHLTDRVWTYDAGAPPPTLRQLVEARRNLLVLSEHGGPPPPWYTAGYGIFQDTPFTFATPQQFTCAANRGPADAPLFEINHFITNASPPSPAEAKDVNSASTLDARLAQCQRERGHFPTILAVDFASVGDLMDVVDRVNGVSSRSG